MHNVLKSASSLCWRLFAILMVLSPVLNTCAFAQVEKLNLPEGFKAEKIYDVPSEQGSWVSMTTDPQGRLIASDQYGKLYRVTLAGESTKVEPINVKIGRAQGLLCAFDCLYVVAHGGDGMPAGLFRVRDTNQDDQYDSVQLLRPFQGGGEHGPHAVILGPDKKSLFICAGNHTDLPNPERSLVPRVWKEDQVLSRLPDANGHATGRMAPGGWICKTDPDGKSFELVSVGFRNEYDIAFDPNGELFTYDADMEWDVGLPWYRPTRVCHVTAGSEFGWRYGTGKWPESYPDSLPGAVDIGPGSPTGIVFGTGAKFPAKYQNALFIADWSYGIIYAIHMQAEGGSFRGEKEVFCSAPALPVTDMVVNGKDGALYFLIGGRRSQSALYRVTYKGSEATETASFPAASEAARLRHQLESNIGSQSPEGDQMALANIGHQDRFVRFAARTVLESSRLLDWRNRLNSETNPQAILELATAQIRTGKPGDQAGVAQALNKLDSTKLTVNQQIHLLRNYGLLIARFGTIPGGANLNHFATAFPSGNELLDREISRLLVAVGEPSVVEKTVKQLNAGTAQHQQVHYAFVLSSAKQGWSDNSRTKYFEWFLKAATLNGGNSFGGYLRNIRAQAVASMPAADQQRFQTLLNQKPPTNDPYAELKARALVKNWTMDDLLPIADTEFENRDLENGKKVFALAACYKCHRVSGQGGIVGPDLTPAGRRFSTQDLLETLLDPSKEVSDQYQATVFQLEDGRMITGRVANLNNNVYMIQTDMVKPNAMVRINVNEIEASRPSKVSMMPTGLLDTFTRDEILDLMAYMKSTSQIK